MRHAATRVMWTNAFILSHKELRQFENSLGISLVVTSTMLRSTLTGSSSRLGERRLANAVTYNSWKNQGYSPNRTEPDRTTENSDALSRDFCRLYTIPRSRSGQWVARRQWPRDASHVITTVARRDMWQQMWRETARDYKYGGARYVICYDSFIRDFSSCQCLPIILPYCRRMYKSYNLH